MGVSWDIFIEVANTDDENRKKIMKNDIQRDKGKGFSKGEEWHGSWNSK